MCNFLHEDSQPIPENGFGWKLFTKGYGSAKLCQWSAQYIYTADKLGWVRFKHSRRNSRKMTKGFCFFIEKPKEEILKHFLSALDVTIEKIEYKGGIGKHIERNMLGGYNIETALCREFKLVNTSKHYL